MKFFGPELEAHFKKSEKSKGQSVSRSLPWNHSPTLGIDYSNNYCGQNSSANEKIGSTSEQNIIMRGLLKNGKNL